MSCTSSILRNLAIPRGQGRGQEPLRRGQGLRSLPIEKGAEASELKPVFSVGAVGLLELARDNPGWGYTKIRDALRGLKIEIARTTVANVLAEAGLEPAPERGRSEERRVGKECRSRWSP